MKNESPSLLSGTVKSAVASSTSFLLLILLVLAARYLGAEDFGLFSFAMSFVILFDVVLDPGLYHYLIRQVARDRDTAQRYLSHALTWKCVAAPLVMLGIIGGLHLLHDRPDQYAVVYLMAIAGILKSYKDAFRSSLLGHEAFGWDAISMGLERVALLLGGAYVLRQGMGVQALGWVFVVVRAVDLVLIAFLVRFRFHRFTLGTDRAFLRMMMCAAIPIAAFYVTLNLYNHLDKVMISVLRNDTEVGWYNAGYKIYEGLFILPSVIATAFMPRLSRLFHERNDGFMELLRRGVKYVAWLALAVAANGFILAEPVILGLYGAEYRPSIDAMRLLMVAMFFAFLLNYLQSAMIAMDRQKIIFYFATTGMVLNIALNLALIPRYGYLGAAATTVGIEAMLLLGYLLYLRKRVARVRAGRLILAPVMLLGAIAAGVWYGLPDLALWLQVAIMNIGFVVALPATGLLSRDEMATLRQWLFTYSL